MDDICTILHSACLFFFFLVLSNRDVSYREMLFFFLFSLFTEFRREDLLFADNRCFCKSSLLSALHINVANIHHGNPKDV